MSTTDGATEHDRQLAHDLCEAVGPVLGSYPGNRVTHAKGVVLAATFTATPRARELSRAAHLQGDPVRVTVRFSNGNPDPHGADSDENDPRGMAVKFYLEDGSTTDVVAQNWPVFPAGTPEDFLALLRAQGESVEATEAFLAEHPAITESSAAVAAMVAAPRSWATLVFHALVAYRLVGADGSEQYVRWRLEPEAGEHDLAPEVRPTVARDYLMDGVLDLLPIRYALVAQLAAPEDQTTDSSRAWPAERQCVDMGTVEITGMDTTREVDGDVLVHDPMNLTDGIEPSDDPILRIRPHVYAESVRRRTGG